MDYINLSRANGMGFTYPICDICRRNVVFSSQNANKLSMKNEKYDPSTESLLIFDCHLESDYNHVFHARCLKNSIKQEILKDKKASTDDTDVLKQLRCIQCYKRN